MGIIFTILIGLVAIALFCVLMDLITWLYSIAWIIPTVILGAFVIRLIFRPDFRAKVWGVILGQKRSKGSTLPPPVVTGVESIEKLNEMIDAAFIDGTISEREKRTIIMKAVEMGIDPLDAETHIASRLAEHK